MFVANEKQGYRALALRDEISAGIAHRPRHGGDFAPMAARAPDKPVSGRFGRLLLPSAWAGRESR